MHNLFIPQIHYGITQLVLMLVILGLAGLGQSAIGFGYALFAIAPLLWIGIPLPSAIAIICTCTAIQSVLAARRLRANVPWGLVYKAALTRFGFMIIGMLLLKVLVDNNSSNIKGIVGGVLCFLVLIQFVWRPKPVDEMHLGWGVLSWISSGLLSGFCGMGGPPLVLWSMAHSWSTKKTKGFLFAVFALISPLQVIMLGVVFGVDILWNVALGLAFSPVVYLGYRIGLPLGSRMDKTKLRRVALTVLFFTGITAVMQTLLK